MENQEIEILKENDIFGVTEDEELESVIIEEKKDGDENVSSENK